MTTVEEPAAAQTVGPRRVESGRTLWHRLAGPAGYLVVVVVQLAVIWPAATQRVFDDDEGFYAIAAKLVAHGKEPYVDFWFQYTPGLPYVYGAWTRLTGESFQNLRNLSVLLTVALGVILYAHVAHRYSRRLGFVAVVLYITSSSVLFWYSTYKSYALSTLLLFVAYVLVAAADRGAMPSTARWFAAGALVGLSVDVRLFFIAVFPVFVYYALDRTRSRGARFANLPALVGGLVVGLLPCLYFFGRGPRRFVSDTLLSQTSRSDLSLLDALVQKLRTIGEVLHDAQFLVLVAAAVAVVVLAYRRHRRVPLAVAIAAALALVSALPTPTYTQYFSTLVPFLAVGAIELWHTLRTTLPRPPDHQLALAVHTVGIVGILLFVAAGASVFDQAVNHGNVPLAFGFTRADVRATSHAIDAHTRNGEVVIAFAPIYLYESHAQPLPGLESNWAIPTARNLGLSDEMAARYKVLTPARIEEVVRSRRIRTVVLGSGPQQIWKPVLTDAGYRLVATVGATTIYQLPKP